MADDSTATAITAISTLFAPIFIIFRYKFIHTYLFWSRYIHFIPLEYAVLPSNLFLKKHVTDNAKYVFQL